jgi:hypothetical protein
MQLTREPKDCDNGTGGVSVARVLKISDRGLNLSMGRKFLAHDELLKLS